MLSVSQLTWSSPCWFDQRRSSPRPVSSPAGHWKISSAEVPRNCESWDCCRHWHVFLSPVSPVSRSTRRARWSSPGWTSLGPGGRSYWPPPPPLWTSLSLSPHTILTVSCVDVGLLEGLNIPDPWYFVITRTPFVVQPLSVLRQLWLVGGEPSCVWRLLEVVEAPLPQHYVPPPAHPVLTNINMFIIVIIILLYHGYHSY